MALDDDLVSASNSQHAQPPCAASREHFLLQQLEQVSAQLSQQMIINDRQQQEINTLTDKLHTAAATNENLCAQLHRYRGTDIDLLEEPPQVQPIVAQKTNLCDSNNLTPGSCPTSFGTPSLLGRELTATGAAVHHHAQCSHFAIVLSRGASAEFINSQPTSNAISSSDCTDIGQASLSNWPADYDSSQNPPPTPESEPPAAALATPSCASILLHPALSVASPLASPPLAPWSSIHSPSSPPQPSYEQNLAGAAPDHSQVAVAVSKTKADPTAALLATLAASTSAMQRLHVSACKVWYGWWKFVVF